MAKNAMGVKNFVKLAKLMPPNTSMLVRADHGVGKSEITAQLSDHFRAELEKTDGLGPNKFPLIDMRLGQITEGDMIGLPFQQDGVTRFMPPWWVKMACDEPCMIFLDELNRGTTEVMQAGFQLVLDRKMQDNKLHPLSRVYAAVNTGASYTVNEMDPALLDRFWTIDLVPTVAEWLEWAGKRDDMSGVIVDFIRQNEKFLDPPHDAEPGTVQVSRRSWHRLSKALIYAGLSDNPTAQEFYQMCIGFVGIEATIKFSDFAKNYDVQISGADVMTKMVKSVNMSRNDKGVILIDEIGKIGTDDDQNKYDERIIKILQEMGTDRLNGMIEKVASYVHKNCKGPNGVDDRRGVALSKFCTLLPAELRVVYWTALVGGNDAGTPDDMNLSKAIHKWCVKHLLAPLGVTVGKAGVGAVPTTDMSIFAKLKK